MTELEALAQEEGWTRYRVDQLIDWLYSHGIQSYDEMSNIPKPMRRALKHNYPLNAPRLVDKQNSRDGSRKYLIGFDDDVLVETVGIPSKNSARVSSSRLSVCISSQVGCSIGCLFCATGQQSFARNLAPGEIADQVLVVEHDFGYRVSNIVVMGQGEPFLNYDNTLKGLRILNSPKGLNIGARHITVSTCGIISGIEKFTTEPEQFTLAISLHAAKQSVRDFLMPGLVSQPLNSLKAALKEYQRVTNRRVSLEYVMISDVNDTQDCLRHLKSFCSDLLCHVNLIPLNPFESLPYEASGRKTLEQWKQALTHAHIETTIRESRGSDIAGACGQLHAKKDEH